MRCYYKSRTWHLGSDTVTAIHINSRQSSTVAGPAGIRDAPGMYPGLAAFAGIKTIHKCTTFLYHTELCTGDVTILAATTR